MFLMSLKEPKLSKSCEIKKENTEEVKIFCCALYNIVSKGSH